MITIITELSEKDSNYPNLLRHINNKPKKLYVLGNLENLNKKCIAIVGTRNCTKYGRKIAELISFKYAKMGYVIVSGLASGIDTSAHIGSILANGKTVAVMGTGLNRIYPYENTNLARKIIYSGGTIITEYSMKDKITNENFAYRNRIISGLCESTIIVEAGKKSGALVTAEFAIEQGRDVYAVPRKYKFRIIFWNK